MYITLSIPTVFVELILWVPVIIVHSTQCLMSDLLINMQYAIRRQVQVMIHANNSQGSYYKATFWSETRHFSHSHIVSD